MNNQIFIMFQYKKYQDAICNQNFTIPLIIQKILFEKKAFKS